MYMANLLIPVSTEDHVLGNPDALLTIVEYGDYESSACRRAAGLVARIMAAKESDIIYAYRHFPIEERHLYAERAAEAAEAAGAQGDEKFWEMHRMLFDHQDKLDYDSLYLYADMLGLDMERFGADMEQHAHLPRVNRDYMRGLQNGIRTVPSFFISNHLYSGAYSLADLLSAVRRGKRRLIQGFV